MDRYHEESQIERFYRRQKHGCRWYFGQAEIACRAHGRPYDLEFNKALHWCGAEARRLHAVSPVFRGFVERFQSNGFFTVAQQLANSVCFWTAYGNGRTIYRVDDDLWADLSNTKFPDAFPVEFLRPPKMAFLLDIPRGPSESHRYIMVFIGSYDGLTKRDLSLRVAEFDNSHALKMPFDEDGGSLPHMLRSIAVLNLDGGALGDVWREFEARSVASGMTAAEAQEQVEMDKNVARGVLNTILYMQSTRDTRTIVEGETRKRGLSQNPKKAAKRERQADMGRHEIVEVGRGYGDAVRSWGGQPEDGVGGVRPHIRAAHAHLYWTGKGKTVPEIKFLAPIRVKQPKEEG